MRWLTVRRRARRFRFRLLGGLLGAILVATLASLPRAPSVLDRAQAASFELNVRYAFAVYLTEHWKAAWPEFEKRTGATVLGPFVARWLGTYYIIYVSGGGTAWFFGQTDDRTYALTNWHVLDIEPVAKDLQKDPAYNKIVSVVIETKVLPCPNFSNFDEYPSCAMGVDIDFADFVLDAAVLEFEFGTKVQKVTTLAFGSYQTVKPGTKTITVGGGVGINDLVGYGQTLPVQPPYLPTAGSFWRFTVPYDMNTVGGFSGSPVVDAATGLVIGLHKGAFIDPRGSGRAVAILVPAEFIAKILLTYGYPVTTTVRLDQNLP